MTESSMSASPPSFSMMPSFVLASYVRNFASSVPKTSATLDSNSPRLVGVVAFTFVRASFDSARTRNGRTVARMFDSRTLTAPAPFVVSMPTSAFSMSRPFRSSWPF
jgi:hypothetical protein